MLTAFYRTIENYKQAIKDGETVKVESIFKGSIIKGSTIEIKQLGGETNDVIHIEEGAPDININDEYIMFLETYDNSPASLLNNIQSLYYVENGVITKHPENNFNITMDILESLSNKE